MNHDAITVDTRVDGTCMFIEITGEIDLANAPLLRETLLRALNKHTGPLVVDLSAVGFIDSTGLSALVSGHQRAKQLDRPYAVCGLQPSARKLFQVTALDSLIPIYADAAEAHAHYADPDTGRQPA